MGDERVDDGKKWEASEWCGGNSDDSKSNIEPQTTLPVGRLTYAISFSGKSTGLGVDHSTLYGSFGAGKGK